LAVPKPPGFDFDGSASTMLIVLEKDEPIADRKLSCDPIIYYGLLIQDICKLLCYSALI
jgi:hypothetical protein